MRRSHLKSGSFDLAKKLPSLMVFMVWQFEHRHVWPSMDHCCSLLVVKFMAMPHLLQFLWLARRCLMRSSFIRKHQCQDQLYLWCGGPHDECWPTGDLVEHNRVHFRRVSTSLWQCGLRDWLGVRMFRPENVQDGLLYVVSEVHQISHPENTWIHNFRTERCINFRTSLRDRESPSLLQSYSPFKRK